MTTPITKDAIPFSQTTRNGWTLTMTPPDLIQLLPPRPPSQLNLFTDVNRPITTRHMGSIETFIADTPNWALPNITLAAEPGTIKNKGRQISLNPGDLQLLDGQHRLQAISNLIHQLTVQNNDNSKVELENLNNQDIPVTIFEVSSNKEQRQLFAWFARSKPIEPAVRNYYDDSDPYNRAAKAAMEDSAVLKTRVTWHTRKVRANSPDLISLADLREIAITIPLGVSRIPKPLDRTIMDQQDVQLKLQAQLIEFFDTFIPSCSRHYGFLTTSPNPNPEILTSKQSSYALNPMVIRLFANVWARWVDTPDHQDVQNLAEQISTLNLNLASPDNDIQTTFGLVNEKRNLHGLRHNSWGQATSVLLKGAKQE